MKLSRIYSVQNELLKGNIVQIEADVSNGLHNFKIIGMADKSINEARDRISAALKHSGFTSPKHKNQKVVISLAPAEIHKQGSLFDVPIALSYLLAIEEVAFNPEEKIFLGELSLNGEINKISGIIPLLIAAQQSGFKEVYIPKENIQEGLFLASSITIFPVENLKDLTEHLENHTTITSLTPQEDQSVSDSYEINLDEIKGNSFAKRALIIAAAGKHNIALFGSPGTGKTMLAKACGGLLPYLSQQETLQKAVIESVTLSSPSLTRKAPFRAPHHDSSPVSILGGGQPIRPGEITKATNGILFLDEFPEFNPKVIEGLREPLEEKKIHIARARSSATFPANCMHIIAFNPCPCGYKYHQKKNCICSASDINRYSKKLSGPIADRIDMWVPVEEVEYEELLSHQKNLEKKTQEKYREQIRQSRHLQKQRNHFRKREYLNGNISSSEIIEYWNIPESIKQILDSFAERSSLSARGYYSILRVARTISDLNQEETITEKSLLEAFQYRRKDDV